MTLTTRDAITAGQPIASVKAMECSCPGLEKATRNEQSSCERCLVQRILATLSPSVSCILHLWTSRSRSSCKTERFLVTIAIRLSPVPSVLIEIQYSSSFSLRPSPSSDLLISNHAEQKRVSISGPLYVRKSLTPATLLTDT